MLLQRVQGSTGSRLHDEELMRAGRRCVLRFRKIEPKSGGESHRVWISPNLKMRACGLLLLLAACLACRCQAAAPSAPAALHALRKNEAPVKPLNNKKQLEIRPAHTNPADLKAVSTQQGPSPALKGWLGVIGGALCHLALGTIYCWGNFSPYTPAKLKYFNGVGKAGAQPDTLWVLPGAFVAQMLTMPIGPKLQKKLGCKGATLLGCWLMATGVFLSSYAQNLATFMLFYSFMMGAGIGIAYTAPMVNGWRWFPDKKGLVSGCVVAGFGSGGFIFNQVGSRIINPQGINAVAGVYPNVIYGAFPKMLRKLALMYFVLTGVGAMFINPPPAIEAAAKATGSEPVAGPVAVAAGIPLSEALKTRAFWTLWVMILGIGTSGIAIAGAYKIFGSTLHPDDNFQALVGSVGALANGAGRLFWGAALDAADFKRPFAALTALQAVTMALYTRVSSSRAGFAAATSIMLFCLGGNFAMFPAYTTKLFGVREGALIYGVLFSAFSIASVSGTFITKALMANFGWDGVFKAMSVLSVLVLGVLATYTPYTAAVEA
jgi:MFS transporter, OFA family, oxalate/formate antiporter